MLVAGPLLPTGTPLDPERKGPDENSLDLSGGVYFPSVMTGVGGYKIPRCKYAGKYGLLHSGRDLYALHAYWAR